MAEPAHRPAACAPDPRPDASAVGLGGSARLVPIVCFQCGMPLNNKNAFFEQQRELLAEDGAEEELYMACGFTRLCCRINISRAASDVRLASFCSPSSGGPFVRVDRASKRDAPVTRMPTDGTTTTLDA